MSVVLCVARAACGRQRLPALLARPPHKAGCPKCAVQRNAAACRHAGMVSAFCERLGWSDLELLITHFTGRVHYGVRSEILALTEIPFVKGYRCDALRWHAASTCPRTRVSSSASQRTAPRQRCADQAPLCPCAQASCHAMPYHAPAGCVLA